VVGPLRSLLGGPLPLPLMIVLVDVRLKKAGELLHTRMLFLRLVTHDVSWRYTQAFGR
jgi:hypothetical protein